VWIWAMCSIRGSGQVGFEVVLGKLGLVPFDEPWCQVGLGCLVDQFGLLGLLELGAQFGRLLSFTSKTILIIFLKSREKISVIFAYNFY
jgi:hypothetical protein